VAASLPLAADLGKELEAFRVKATASRNEVFESWRERDHDDLVRAVALALFVGSTLPTFIAVCTAAAGLLSSYPVSHRTATLRTPETAARVPPTVRVPDAPTAGAARHMVRLRARNSFGPRHSGETCGIVRGAVRPVLLLSASPTEFAHRPPERPAFARLASPSPPVIARRRPTFAPQGVVAPRSPDARPRPRPGFR
jgi:hypothetical protein